MVAQEEEKERMEKQIVLKKIATIQAELSNDKLRSRGKRNSSALISYIKSMGKIYFPIFCAFTVGNIGFRSAQRKFQFFSPFPIVLLAKEILQALWLNVWTAANAANPNANIQQGYYIGIYVMFGGLNVVFLGLQFWYVYQESYNEAHTEGFRTFMIIIVPHSARLLHKRVLTAVMQ